MNSEWLQYGAMGLLALVLGGIGLWLRGYLGEQQKRGAKSDQWMRDLIATDRQERRDSSARMDALVHSAIEAQQRTFSGLDSLEKKTDSHETASQSRHDKMLNTIRVGN